MAASAGSSRRPRKVLGVVISAVTDRSGGWVVICMVESRSVPGLSSLPTLPTLPILPTLPWFTEVGNTERTSAFRCRVSEVMIR